MIDPQRIKVFLDRFPLLSPVIDICNKNEIDWMIGGSGCLFLLGNERLPDDVDIFLPDSVHDRVDALFGISSFIYTSNRERVRNSNYQGDHSIQFTSHLVITIDHKEFSLAITSSVLENKNRVTYKDSQLFLLPPEDVLLIKAILQRGADMGKKDIEDIASFRLIYPDLNVNYLKQRIAETHSEDRVNSIFTA